jgi:hypothetical protein
MRHTGTTVARVGAPVVPRRAPQARTVSAPPAANPWWSCCPSRRPPCQVRPVVRVTCFFWSVRTATPARSSTSTSFCVSSVRTSVCSSPSPRMRTVRDPSFTGLDSYRSPRETSCAASDSDFAQNLQPSSPSALTRPPRGSVQAVFTWSKKKRTKASAPASVCSLAAAGISGPEAVTDGEGEGVTDGDALDVADAEPALGLGSGSDCPVHPPSATAPATTNAANGIRRRDAPPRAHGIRPRPTRSSATKRPSPAAPDVDPLPQR